MPLQECPEISGNTRYHAMLSAILMDLSLYDAWIHPANSTLFYERHDTLVESPEAP
jgi:acetoacetate decarboxylase